MLDPAGARPLWDLALPDYAPDARPSPDGGLLAAATVAGPVVVLDLGTGAERFRAPGHPGGAHAVAWSVMLPILATGGADGDVALLAARDGQVRARLHLGRGWVDRLAWSGDGTTLAASVGRSVCFLSADGALRSRFDGHPSTVTGLAWHAGRGALLTASYGVLSLLSPDDPEPLAQRYFRTSLLTVSPSADGRFVATGTQDPLVHVWDLEDEGNEVSLTGYGSKVTVLAWSPAQALLATGSGAGLVIWDFEGGDPLRQAPRVLRLEGGGRVTALVFLWSGELLAGTEGGLLWAVDPAREEGDPRGRTLLGRTPGAVCGIVPSADGRSVVVIAAGGRLLSFALADDA